jgi:hypothetical protein
VKSWLGRRWCTSEDNIKTDRRTAEGGRLQWRITCISGGLLWQRSWTSVFIKRREIYWLAERLLVCQEGFRSMKLAASLKDKSATIHSKDLPFFVLLTFKQGNKNKKGFSCSLCNRRSLSRRQTEVLLPNCCRLSLTFLWLPNCASRPLSMLKSRVREHRYSLHSNGKVKTLSEQVVR